MRSKRSAVGWGLFSIVALTGCGEDGAGAGAGATGGGSSGAESSTTSASSASATTGATASVAATASSATGLACEGTLALDPACVPCADSACCEAQADCFEEDACLLCLAEVTPSCAMHPLFHALDACLQSSCADTCDPLTPPSAACDAPVPSPSNGACVTIGGNVACNPFTNEGCARPKVCDAGLGGGYACFDPPSDAALCEPCGSAVGNYCDVGMTCVGVCYKLCCDDADCGSGSCDKTHAQYAPAGICAG